MCAPFYCHVIRLTDELTAVVEFLESKSEVNPKEIALARREEMKKKREVKNPGKKKGKKGVSSLVLDLILQSLRSKYKFFFYPPVAF